MPRARAQAPPPPPNGVCQARGGAARALRGRRARPHSQPHAQGAISLSARSTLVLDGHVTIEHLALDGALAIRAAPGCAAPPAIAAVTRAVTRT
eukprot:2574105-Prymnesium_polylepis.1